MSTDERIMEYEQEKKMYPAVVQLYDYQETIHKKNKKRIQWGIRVLVVCPMIFLLLMILMDSNKNIFLLLWIITLFVLASYLISVEYMDFQMQKKMKQIGVPALNPQRDATVFESEAILEDTLDHIVKQYEQDENKKPIIRPRQDEVETIIVRDHSFRGGVPERIPAKNAGEDSSKMSNNTTLSVPNSRNANRTQTKALTELEMANIDLQRAIQAKIVAEMKVRMEADMKEDMTQIIADEMGKIAFSMSDNQEEE